MELEGDLVQAFREKEEVGERDCLLLPEERWNERGEGAREGVYLVNSKQQQRLGVKLPVPRFSQLLQWWRSQCSEEQSEES